jgi:hypothetical protein
VAVVARDCLVYLDARDAELTTRWWLTGLLARDADVGHGTPKPGAHGTPKPGGGYGHWRDAAQQGLVAGLSAAGQPAAWNKVPEFSCTIGESTLKYRGWGTGYEHSRLVDHHDGFTVHYESGGELVGVLTQNADDDYRRATASLVDGTSSRARGRSAR